MKILVAAQAEKLAITVAATFHAAIREIVAACQQSCRGAMLEAAIALPDHHGEEQIAAHRWWRPEEIDLPLADTAQIGTQPLEITIVMPCKDNFVRNPASLERGKRELAHFDRMIDELIVSSRTV